MKRWSHHIKELEENDILIYHSEDLNERYYGELQGMNKDRAKELFGEKKVFEWRRSYDIRPPKGESLKDVYKRTTKYYKKNILPLIQSGKNIIISAHGNSLRALIKYIENISDEDIPKLELPTGKPIIYDYKEGKYNKLHDEHSFNRPLV
jgi:2,3-bisphosphoglycerate-dependent phosphoglycerate mutase